MAKTVKIATENRGFFPVVGIAVGVGGMNSVIKLVSSLPVDSEMAYVIIAQQSAEYPENISEVLSQCTSLPVSEIINIVNLAANYIYVVPQNSNLIVQGNLLQLHQRTRLDKADESFDLFFESLARLYKSAVIGIVLSGTGFDGIKGFKKLVEIGAATVVQAPQTAICRELPQSIVNAGLADYIETPEFIAQLLENIVRNFDNAEAYREEESCTNETQEFIDKILDIIALRTGTHCRQYKQHLVRRRIAHRMVIASKSTLESYFAFVRHSKQEQDMLFNDLLIPVTGFFSDASFYGLLTSAIFPKILQNGVTNGLRIWIVGCSSGQEAYSVAISLHEYLLQTNNPEMQVQIFGSDLSVRDIEKARKGIYLEQDLHEISETRRQNYFTKRIDGYHVKDVIRNMCIFTVHDVVDDPPLMKMDLVCCQNVLAFFKEHYQSLALKAFHYALREEGVLYLGASDEIVEGDNLFKKSNKNQTSYIRNSAPGQNRNELAVTSTIDTVKIPLTIVTMKTRGYPIDILPQQGSKVPEALAEVQEQLLHSNKNPQQESKLFYSFGDDLQSKNEELKVLNSELADRQKQLSTSGDFTETILQIMHEPVVQIDKNFFIKSANLAFYKYFKTDPMKTDGFSFFEIGNCQWDISDFKEQIFKILHEGTVLQNYKLEADCEGIGKKIMNVSARKLLGHNPNGIILMVLQDITELESVHEVLESKNLELHQYNDLLQTFAVAASHNMVDPLHKIQMLGTRILDTELNAIESSRHNLQRILYSAGNMKKLIEDLILYAKLCFQQKDYKRTDLNLIVKKNLMQFKNSIQQKKILIRVDPMPHLAAMPEQILQLFKHIIFNAIQYKRNDVIPEIIINACQPSEEEIIEMGGNPEISFTKISITDNGIGFNKQYTTQVFDPFFRLHNNDQYKGSGLGLTMVKKIVSNHQGFVKVFSRSNEGTQIVLYLPLQQV